ncbi:hypothetical protein L9F63_011377 [Diploptera punctata]|uniref:Platelet-derived growth factor (PDGF) family profile domain-containing protein n=1 Tax=Diploptera punctata TaxID=6984 RepID=A0AAD8AEY8_DIPPU|nr:hypothetical protein L9F63_011377 [Diploptera punctata]
MLADYCWAKKRDILDAKYYHFLDGKCSSTHFIKFREHAKRSKCLPRETIVQIKTGDPDYLFEPEYVEVKRCGGICSPLLSCTPIKEKNVKTSFNVQKVNLDRTLSQCGTVEVEEHQECVCDCTVMEHHCNKKIQEYDPDECRCICKMDMAEECATMDKLWDPKECKCYCKNQHDKNNCSSMEYWHPHMCRCVRMHHENENSIPS